MAIPTQHNCPHSADGWCLACVSALAAERDQLVAEREAIQNDSRTLTCVYCGHVYPPGTPTSNHRLLTQHIAECPKHPMRTVVDSLKLYAESLGATDAKDAYLVWGEDNHGDKARETLDALGISYKKGE